MKKSLLGLLIVMVVTLSTYSQNDNGFYIHPFSNAVAFSLEGGTSYTNSDFARNRFDYLGRGMVEYFFYSNNIGTFGLRLYGGISYLGGEGGLKIKSDNFPSLQTLKTDVYYLGGGYSYTISLDDVLHPYLFAGLSYIQFYPRVNNNIRISSISQRKFANEDINYLGEVGLRVLFYKNFSLNFSGTVNINPSDNLDGIYANEDNDIFYSANMGLSYYFLYAKDSDGDGIDDSEDMCPNTPPYINVNDFGCPRDSDNDGIPDNKDICPNTPVSIVVDKNGCPVDLDEDGVPDNMDKCLYTPKGTKVDSVGCPVTIPEDTSYNRTIINNFSFAESEIPFLSLRELNKLANYMLEHPELNWEIQGHCDNISVNCDKNYELSVERAKRVFKFLTNKGVNSNRIKIIGFSKYHPIAENNSETGRALNRRVEILKIR